MQQSFPLLEDQIYTIPEVAAYLKISKSKIYYLVSKKEIPHLKIGRNVRIRRTDLQMWIEKQTNESNVEILPRKQ